MTASKSVATTFTYDAKGNLKTVEAPAPLGTTTYTYDDLGRVSSAKDARGITITYAYDHRDRVKKVSSLHSNYQTVTYEYDGEDAGDLTQRSDGTGVIKYDSTRSPARRSAPSRTARRPSWRTPRRAMFDTYQDPPGLTDYTWNKVNKLKELKDPRARPPRTRTTRTTCGPRLRTPGNTVQTVTPDKSGRPEKIKAASPKGTLVDLAYTYARQDGKDGGKISSTTDAVRVAGPSYEYDSAGRFLAAERQKRLDPRLLPGGAATSLARDCASRAWTRAARAAPPTP
ncbi:RHS repeat-associated core domain-containing protein [Streptomyces californicus]